MGKASAGVWGITFEEIAALEMPHAPSPTSEAPAHMHIDFNSTGVKTWKAKAQMLADFASEHGTLYPTGATEQLPLMPE